QRRDQCCEELIADRRPLAAAKILLVKLVRSSRTQARPKKTTATAKPTNIRSFGTAADAPHESSKCWVVFRVKRLGGTEGDEVAFRGILVRITVNKIDIQRDEEVVFLLCRRHEREPFSNRDLIRGYGFILHGAICTACGREFAQDRAARLIQNCA